MSVEFVRTSQPNRKIRAYQGRPEILLLRERMQARGFSLRSWAEAKGYKPTMVREVVRKHWGRTDTRPCGVKTCRILDLLMEEFGDEE